jgi:hypothetical protein
VTAVVSILHLVLHKKIGLAQECRRRVTHRGARIVVSFVHDKHTAQR